MGPFSILSKFLKKEEPEESNYLSLVLTPDRVLATIWKFENEQIVTLGFGQKSFENADVLVHEAAIAIDIAGKQAKVDITDVVFGISEYYLDNSSLTDSSTKTLKRLSQELELEAQAFVSLAGGVNRLLKIEESVTPNAILVGIFNNFCETHLLEGNKVSKTKSFKGTVNIEKIKNLIESLKEEDTNLPAKIVVFGINESTPLAQNINKKDWGDLFVHEPKVEFLDDSELSRSIAYAQAADVLGHDPSNNNEVEETPPAAKEITKDEKEEEKEPPETNELGFVAGEDILLNKETSPKKEEKEEKQEDGSEEESNVTVPEKDKEEYAVETQHQIMQRPVEVEEDTTPKPSKPKRSFKFAFPKLPLNIFKKRPGKKLLIALGILLFVAIGAAFAAAQTLTKAQVVIKVNSQSLEKDFEAKAEEGASLNIEEKTIGAQLLTGKASGSKKAVTSGSKTIGENAKGEITIFNWTSTPKSFPQGTTIITKNGIKFTLDDPVEATSAAPPSGSSPGSPGKASAKITAEKVGPDYNLDAGQQFTFSEYDQYSYSAQNDAAITGGSEREVTVVAQEDIDTLEKDLLETLSQQAKDDLKSKAGGEKFLDDAVNIDILSKKFDKGLDEEASVVNLDMEVEANVLVYNEDDLKQILAEINKDEAPENLQIKPENIQIVDISSKREDDTLILSGKLKANLIPKFDENELKNAIAGKSIKEARAKIKELPGVTDVNVNFTPKIPLLGSIPKDKDKISFKVETI